jgi:hypothetical protein
MEFQEVEVVIDANGEVQIEVRGVKGRACLDLTDDLVAALGGEVCEQELTAEADEAPSEVNVLEPARVRR